MTWKSWPLNTFNHRSAVMDTLMQGISVHISDHAYVSNWCVVRNMCVLSYLIYGDCLIPGQIQSGKVKASAPTMGTSVHDHGKPIAKTTTLTTCSSPNVETEEDVQGMDIQKF
ncbi:unnamed protein product [Urochloa humidicola]